MSVSAHSQESSSPTTISSINLNQVLPGAAFIATTVEGWAYHVQQDRALQSDNPAMAHVIVRVTPRGADKPAAAQHKLYANAVVEVDKPWYLGTTDVFPEGFSTEAISRIKPAPEGSYE